MSYIDLSNTLQEWPYEPDKISVRKILGVDDSVKIQQRVELGFIQMEYEGRPDGVKPNGLASFLGFIEKKLQQHAKAKTREKRFVLSPEDCSALRIEAGLFYKRFVALFVLEEHKLVQRDVSHVLQIADLLGEYADEKERMEEYRPYLLMMLARAQAYEASEANEIPTAIAHLRRGIMDLKHFFERHEMPIAERDEIRMLEAHLHELVPVVPEGTVISVHSKLRQAIASGDKPQVESLRKELNRRLSGKR